MSNVYESQQHLWKCIRWCPWSGSNKTYNIRRLPRLNTYLKKTTPVLDVAVAPMSLGSRSVKFVKCFQWGFGVFSNLKQVLTSPPQACKLKQFQLHIITGIKIIKRNAYIYPNLYPCITPDSLHSASQMIQSCAK